MKEECILLIDPNSYGNLQMYDDKLLEGLSHIAKERLMLVGNVKYIEHKNKGYDVELIYSYSDKRGFNKVFSYLKSSWRLIDFIKKNKLRVVHFQWFKLYYLDFLIIEYIKILLPEIKIVYTAHNILPHNSGEKYFNIFKKIYHSVHNIIVHDEITKRKLADKFCLPINKISTIPHGLFDFDLSKQVTSNKINKIFDKIPEHCIKYLMIGKISKYKGIDILYDAWKTFSNDKNRHLIIAGSDEKQLCKPFKSFKNVSIIDEFLLDEEFTYLIEKSDIIVLPYLQISQSGVLLTVINQKKSVIVSPIGGLIDPFKFGKIGWVMDSIDSKSLIEIILKVSKEDILEIESNHYLWNTLFKQYDWDEIAQKTYDVYNKMDI